MAEVIFQNPQALLALPLIWLLMILFSWRRRFRPFGPFLLRLAIIVLIMTALARPTTVPESSEQQLEPLEPLVVLVDQSASLGAAGREALRAEAARLAQARDEVLTIFFADRPILIDRPLGSLSGQDAAPNQEESMLNPEVTNLAEALALGSELLKDQAGRLVLLSDGVPTAGDTMKIASHLAQQRIPVDVLIPGSDELQIWQGPQNEVRVVELRTPSVLRVGETYEIEVTLHSQVPADVTLNLTQNSAILAEDVVPVEAGLNRFTFTVTADAVGPQSFRATVAADDDLQPENNALSAVAQVYPAPHILVVGSDSFEANRFATMLGLVGFEAETMLPSNLPDRLSELESYAGMVLMNVPAQAFALEQMLAIQEFVRSLGRGLVVTGGDRSYILGGYEDTPLAELLPVSLESPPRDERPPVALLLIIDHSGSMIEQRSPVTRLAMAKEAAIRATDILGPDDLIGVFIFDNRYEWAVPFQQVSSGADLLEIQHRIARIPPGGGTRILQAIEVALPALMEQETANARHAILLSDGKSFDGARGREDYEAVVDAALAADVTLSTIAIGSGADQELLAHLAERGKGRYHFAENPEDLPALTISESDILRSDAIQEGEFGVAIFAPHPLLRGIFSPLPVADREQAPSLNGYLAMTPKPRSEIALQVGPGDPLLAVWGYGLGRVVAWSSDVGNEWAVAWRDWPDYSRFWGQVIGYTLPRPDLGLLQLEAVVQEDGEVTLVADGVTATGLPVDGVRTEGTVLTPGGQESSFGMYQVAPGRYERELRLPNLGAYQLMVTQPQPEADNPEEAATLGFVLSYPDEYALPSEGAGAQLLGQIATMTGGRPFALNQLLPLNVTNPVDNTAPVAEPVELWPWLLIAALALWPVEIAWRRWQRMRIQ